MLKTISARAPSAHTQYQPVFFFFFDTRFYFVEAITSEDPHHLLVMGNGILVLWFARQALYNELQLQNFVSFELGFVLLLLLLFSD